MMCCCYPMRTEDDKGWRWKASDTSERPHKLREEILSISNIASSQSYWHEQKARTKQSIISLREQGMHNIHVM